MVNCKVFICDAEDGRGLEMWYVAQDAIDLAWMLPLAGGPIAGKGAEPLPQPGLALVTNRKERHFKRFGQHTYDETILDELTKPVSVPRALEDL